MKYVDCILQLRKIEDKYCAERDKLNKDLDALKEYKYIEISSKCIDG